MAFVILFVLAFIVANASNQPGISGSVQISTLNIASKLALAQVGPLTLNQDTILLDEI